MHKAAQKPPSKIHPVSIALAARKKMEPLEQNHAERESIRARVDSLGNAIFLISGGALSVSIGVMVRAGGEGQLSAQAVKLASQSWYLLVVSIVSFVLLKAHLIFQAFLLQTKTDFADRNNTLTNTIGWVLGISGMASFIIGIVRMIMAAVEAVGS